MAPEDVVSPMRDANNEECHHTDECCGQCHAAVGGCLKGVQVIYSIRGTGQTYKEPAGISMKRIHGTPPMRLCTTHMRWELIPQTKG